MSAAGYDIKLDPLGLVAGLEGGTDGAVWHCRGGVDQISILDTFIYRQHSPQFTSAPICEPKTIVR